MARNINGKYRVVAMLLSALCSYAVLFSTPSYAVLKLANNETEKVVLNDSLNSIIKLDFGLNEQQAGQLTVIFNNGSIASRIQRKNRRLEIELLGSNLADNDIYVMNVLDFATPVKSYETVKDSAGTRIIVQMKSDFEFSHQILKNRFVLTVSTPAKNIKKVENKIYSGKKMSLNFQKVAVRTALQMIADYNNLNLVTGDSVDGELTLHLKDVPWDQALDIILKLRGLGKRIEGNILLIAPAKELANQEAAQLLAAQQVQQLVPLVAEYVQINYAKAKDIAVLLDGDGAKLLSARGSVSVDERTNILLIQDTAKRLSDIRRLIKVLDIAVKQVVIEARIVTVTDNVNEEFGIRWGITDSFDNGAMSGNLQGVNSAASGIVPNLSDRLNVNLPVSEPAGTIAFQVAKLANGTLLDLELTALERENKGEIIARPSITTANQKPAFIEQGTEIPYVSASSSGATTVTFKPAVLSLRVTPHITPDGRVILDLIITQDTRGDTVKTAIGEAVAIDTQKISTQVLVDNGETIVLGGIYQQQSISAVSKVPFFGDLPLIGWLFRTQKEFTERRELLIFVTPRIIQDKLNR